MAKKGGYQILNLGGMSLTPDAEKVIAGSYEALEGNYNKPVLVSGLVVNATEYNDFYALFTPSNSNFVAEIPGLGSLTVKPDDKAVFTLPIEGG